MSISRDGCRKVGGKPGFSTGTVLKARAGRSDRVCPKKAKVVSEIVKKLEEKDADESRLLRVKL